MTRGRAYKYPLNRILVGLFLICIPLSDATTIISFSDNAATMKKGTEMVVPVYISGPRKNITIHFQTEDDDIVSFIPSRLDLDRPEFGDDEGQVATNVTILAKRAGRTTVFVNASDGDVKAERAFVLLSIYQEYWMEILSIATGWAYFVCWSVCFYPQVFKNFTKKSVVGLSFDFVAISMTGFVSYTIFNSCLFWSPDVQNMYFEKHPRGVIPVTTNDWLFAVHAASITAFIIGQCLRYERGGQVVSIPCRIFLGVVYVLLGLCLVLALSGVFSILQFLYVFSYVKVLMTLIQYTPQVYLNYKRKSTTGWSVGFVWLDIFGGIFSLMQMFIIAINYEDWSSITGYLAKLGLSILTLAFDGVFMVQHYWLYRNSQVKPVPQMDLQPAQEFWKPKGDGPHHQNGVAKNQIA